MPAKNSQISLAPHQKQIDIKQYCFLCALDQQGQWLARINEIPNIIVRDNTLNKVEKRLNDCFKALLNQDITVPPPDKRNSILKCHMMVVSLDKWWANKII